MVRSFHAVQLRKADVAIRTVGQAVVNLIGQHNDIRVLMTVAIACSSSRVIIAPVGLLGYGRMSSLARGRNSGAQTVRRQLELVPSARVGSGTGTPPAICVSGLQAYKTRLRNQHLIAHVDNRTDGVVDRPRSRRPSQGILVRIVAQAVLAARARQSDCAARQDPSWRCRRSVLFPETECRRGESATAFQTGSPTPSEIACGILAASSKKRRMPEGCTFFYTRRENLLVVHHAMTSLYRCLPGRIPHCCPCIF